MPRLVLLALLIATRAAAAFQDLDALDRQVAIRLGADIGQPGGAVSPIDRRLKLGACPQPTVVEPGIGGTVTVRCPALGWRLRVLTSGGSPAPSAQTASAQAAFAGPRLRAEPVVRRGDPVQMSVETDSFAVTVEAIADQDGAPGDRIRIHTDERNGPRTAQVIDAGRVAITGFR